MMNYIAIFMIVISSGSMYFTIMNVQITLYFLLFIALLVAVVQKPRKTQFYHNLMVYVVILLAVVMNLAVNSQYAVIDNNLIILLIRLTSLVVIQSCITYDDFVKCYVRIMVTLSVISILCFAYTMLIGPSLPFLIEKVKNGSNYYYTFYHTVGYRIIYARNSGIFWEAPAYSIFLNIALMMLICNMNYFDNKKVVSYFFILSTTVFTTLSVYGFISYGLIIVLLLLRLRRAHLIKEEIYGETQISSRKQTKRTRRLFIILGIVAIVVLFFVERKYEIISHKLVNRGGSYTTRQNDTLYSLYVASQRLWFGYGIFNNYSVNALSALGVINNSNGYMILLIAIGLPLLVICSVYCLRNVYKEFELSWIECIIVSIVFLLFYSSEHLWLYTLFLSFFFRWKKQPIQFE